MVHLARGDMLYFDSRIGHAYVTVSRQLARTIGACTSESQLMLSAREGGVREFQRAEPATARRRR